MPEKPVFCDFLEILSLVFSYFLHIDAYQYSLKYAEKSFAEKIFFPSVEPEMCRKSLFFWIFVILFQLIQLFLQRTRFLIEMLKIQHGDDNQSINYRIVIQRLAYLLRLNLIPSAIQTLLSFMMAPSLSGHAKSQAKF